MKRNWWETDNAMGLLIILVSIFASCLLWYKNDLWICWSAIYMYGGTWVYHLTVENKNHDIEYLNYRVNELERYTKHLEEELKKQ